MLKADIEQVILFQIEKTNKRVKQYSQQQFDRQGLGITVEQWVLLKILDEEGMSQTSLATKSMRNPASITRTLDILSKKGIIERQAVEGNRRQHLIVLSKKGNEFVADHLPMVMEQRALSTKGFSKKELAQLSSYLQRIQDNMT